MGSPGEAYEKFMNFCSISLKGENPKFLDLIKSRYMGCDDAFRTSLKMILLLERTQKNMSSEESRKFVHLKDLLTELKKNAAFTKKKRTNKRKHSVEAETEHPEKIPKLKGCSVMMDKFSSLEASFDQNIATVESDDSSKLYPRKYCSIADGNFNNAPCISIATNDEIDNLKKELGSGFECHIGSPLSPTCILDSGGKCHSNGESTHTNNVYNSGAPIIHTSHNTDDSKEKSPRKSVSIIGVHDVAQDGCIRTLSDSSSVCNSHMNDIRFDEVSHVWLVKDDIDNIKRSEHKVSKLETSVKSVSISTDSSAKTSTFIADVDKSKSTDLLNIEPSSSCKKHLDCSSTKGNHIVPSPVGCVDNALVKYVVRTSTESICFKTDNIFRMQSGANSCDLNSLSFNSGETTSQALFGAVPEKLSLSHQPFIAAQLSPPSYISDCVSAIIKNLEDETTLEQSLDVNDQKSEKQGVHDDTYRQDTSTLDVRSSVDKLPKRVSLLVSTKTDAVTNNHLFGVTPYSHGSEHKAAQESESSNAGETASSSWVEAETSEPGASADEFQNDNEHSNGLDKLKQKRVLKLERLLASLHNEIEKCQATEMSLEDLEDENATYMYEDKLKRKFVAVWNKLCQITERSVTTGRPTEKSVRYSGTRYKEINRRIEKFLNKKKVFPDFHDIKSIVKMTNKKCSLNMNAMMINDVAREAFVDIGEMLQTRRHQDFISTFGTRQTDILRASMDPYMTDPELRKKIDSNRHVAKLNLDSMKKI